MGDPAGQLAERLHFLSLAQFRFHLLFVRDVLGEGEQERLASLRGAELGQPDAGPCDEPGTGEVARFDAMVRAARSPDRIVEHVAVVGVRDVCDAPADQFFGVITKHPAERRICLDDVLPVLPRQQHAERALVECTPEALVTFLQRGESRLGQRLISL